MGEGRAAHVLPAVALGAVVGLAVFIGQDPAAASPFDVAGHWAGTSQQEGQPASALVADFTSTGSKTFTGTVTAEDPCTATGKLKRHMKVAVRVDCGNGSIAKIRG